MTQKGSSLSKGQKNSREVPAFLHVSILTSSTCRPNMGRLFPHSILLTLSCLCVPTGPTKSFLMKRRADSSATATVPSAQQSSSQSGGVRGLRCHCWRGILGAGFYLVDGSTSELQGHPLPTNNTALLKQRVNQSNNHGPSQLPGAARCNLRTWFPSIHITHSNCSSTNRTPATNKY